MNMVCITFWYHHITMVPAHYFFITRSVILRHIDFEWNYTLMDWQSFFLSATEQEQNTCSDNCNILQLWDTGTENQIAECSECVYTTEECELQDTLCVHDMENSCEILLILGAKIWHVIITVSGLFFTLNPYVQAVIVFCVYMLKTFTHILSWKKQLNGGSD